MTLYEAATLPITGPRMDSLPLSRLVDARLHMHTTMVVPPAMALQRDEAMMERIRRLDDGVETEAVSA